MTAQAKFPLPKLSNFLDELRDDIINGKGFLLFKGLPVTQWGNHKSAVAYMGLGTYLGYFVSQNGLGHVLGHVKDTGADPTQIDKVRIYRTRARQFFHADDSDIVGLLCIARALEGDDPARFVANMAKAKRKGRIFVDYLRNGRGSTAIMPFSARARAGAPVSVPVSWTELRELDSAHPYGVRDAATLIERANGRGLQGWGVADQVLPDL